MRHVTARLAAIAAMSVVSLPVLAEYDSVGLYLSGNLGRASADLDGSRRSLDRLLRDSGFTNLSSSVDDDDLAYKVGMGIQLNRYFALEGTWVDLGKFDYRGVGNEGALAVGMESKGVGGSLVGRLPFEDGLSLYARVGWHSLKTKVSARAVGGGGSASASSEDSETVGSWGLGVAWQFSPQISLLGEFERYRDVGSDELTGGDGDIDFWSVGLRYDLL
ncbi:outer membrane beta-barrel protein [Pseudomonas stutzeri]|nr:outer membrane beta-barrel protein [Stutzerimonas stutzeri]